MRVLLDFTQVPLQRTGVGVYADHLLQELAALMRPPDCLYVAIQDDDPLHRNDRLARLHVHFLPVNARIFRRRAALLLFEQTILPLLALRHHADVLHSLHYTHPLVAPCARAVTIHDLTFTLFPELHTRARRLLFPFFTRRAMRAAECPLFVSRSTEADAERLFGPSRFPGHVTRLGVATSAPATPQQTQAALRQLGVRVPFVLFLGTLEPRKNLRRVLSAFEWFAERHPPFTLLIAGKLGWNYREFLAALEGSPVRARVQTLGFVTEGQKAALLAGCAMLVYPSLYEGFGLPVLEGLAAGAPVVTSDVSSMPEVAGEAALLVDPLSVEAIADAMSRIAADPRLAARLREAGPRRAGHCTWAQSAEATYRAYRATVESDRNPKRIKASAAA